VSDYNNVVIVGTVVHALSDCSYDFRVGTVDPTVSDYNNFVRIITLLSHCV
jgi:hypothetical protein